MFYCFIVLHCVLAAFCQLLLNEYCIVLYCIVVVAVRFCTDDAFAAARCMSGKLLRLYLNSKLVFEYNATGRRAADNASRGGSDGPVFRDYQHRIRPVDRLAIGCCVDANTTDAYGTIK